MKKFTKHIWHAQSNFNDISNGSYVKFFFGLALEFLWPQADFCILFWEFYFDRYIRFESQYFSF